MDYTRYGWVVALAFSIVALVETYRISYVIRKQVDKAVDRLFVSAIKQLHEETKPGGLSSSAQPAPTNPVPQEPSKEQSRNGVQIRRG